MWMAIALVGAALFSVVSTAISSSVSKQISDDQIDLQRETNEQNQENFETELKYNSVGSQITQQRLAGVNPDLQDSQPTQSAGSLPELQSPDLSSLASSLTDSIMSFSQQIGSIVMQGMNVKQMQFDLDNSKTRNAYNNLLLNSASQNFVYSDIANSADVSWFERHGLTPDSSPDEFDSLYDTTPDLKFISPEEFDGGELNDSAVTASRFDKDYYKKLGYNDDDADRLAKIARSALSRPDVQRKIYDNAAQRFRSRRAYDFEDNNPFNRDSIQDVPSAFIAYCNVYAQNLKAELDAHFASNKDISDMFGLKEKYSVGDLQYQANALKFKSDIDQIKKLIELGYPEASAELMSSSIDFQILSLQLESLAKNATINTVSKGLNSSNYWSRTWAMYQMNQMQNGNFVPFSVASEITSDVSNIADIVKVWKLISSMSDVGNLTGDKSLGSFATAWDADISTPEGWSSFNDVFGISTNNN